MQSLLDHGEYPHSDNDGDHVSLISHHVDVIEAEEYGLCLLYSLSRHGVRVLERRVDHDHTDDGSQIGVRPEGFRRGECDQDL